MIKFSLKDEISFSKRLSFLCRAHIPLSEALLIIAEQTSSKSHKKLLQFIHARVTEGATLSQSIQESLCSFSSFGLNLIEVGESSGTLSTNLDYLAEELHKRGQLKKKIIGAFIYPAIVCTATIGITLFLIIYLFPKITPVFLSLHVKLPLSTRIVMSLSNSLRYHGLLIIAIMFVLMTISITFFKRSDKLKKIYDSVTIRIPILGNISKNNNLANLTRTLSILLESHATITEALPIVAHTFQNSLYKEACLNALKNMESGMTLASHFLTRPNLFPRTFCHIIAVGERGGNLSESLLYLSKLYEDEIQNTTKTISDLVEPLLMVTMGLAVGFIAISIITPIYGITQNLHP